ncbi:MAG: sigma-70 family RNA polymerase sigma factor [Oscillospiraceae bacterium]|nr:sigma-70 family RNA polymerase sigma factor [Oscillospiraceae bacterium]
MPEERKIVVEENLGLVHACAHRFNGRGIEYEDLYGAGCIGLCKAAEAFDWNRGVKFSTYAVPVILGEIRRLFRDGGTVKVSRSLKELGMRVQRAREELCARTGSEPTVLQLAEYLELEPEQVAEAAMAASPVLSLTESDEEGGGQIDLPVESPEEKITDRLSLRQAMQQLDERDRRLIVLRYYGRKTQSQTASILGMTQVQVSRREKKLLLFMREKLTG